MCKAKFSVNSSHMSACSIVEWHVAENQHVKDEELFVSIIPDRLQELGSDEGKAVLEVCFPDMCLGVLPTILNLPQHSHLARQKKLGQQ